VRRVRDAPLECAEGFEMEKASKRIVEGETARVGKSDVVTVPEYHQDMKT